uniref:protein-serine/threonine phosphatase n=1 Tax=Ascaris suum TaxID=6253 RepID=F1KYI3_ASCSU
MIEKTIKCSSGGIALSRIEKGLLTILNCVQFGERLSTHSNEKLLVQILHRSEVRFLKEAMLLELPLTEYGIVVIGDLHGSMLDLLIVLHNIGLPPDVRYLFLGDYIGFGPHQIELLLFILLLKLRWPEHIYMLRGKHETYEVSINNGFRTVCDETFPNTRIFLRFNALFDCMPIAAIISDKIICCHGGISRWMSCRDNIRQIPRPPFIEKMKLLDCCLLADILWANSNTKQSRPFVPSECDVSYTFNEDALNEVLNALQVSALVRGRSNAMNGYVEEFRTKCYAIGTSTDPQNKDIVGAVLGIRSDVACEYHFQPILHRRVNAKGLVFYCRQISAQLEDSFISDYEAPLGAPTCSRCQIQLKEELQTSARIISHIEIVDWVLMNAKREVLHDVVYKCLDAKNLPALARRLVHLFPLYYDLIYSPGGTFRVGLTDGEWSIIQEYYKGLEVNMIPYSIAVTKTIVGIGARKTEISDITCGDKKSAKTTKKIREGNVKSGIKVEFMLSMKTNEKKC